MPGAVCAFALRLSELWWASANLAKDVKHGTGGAVWLRGGAGQYRERKLEDRAETNRQSKTLSRGKTERDRERERDKEREREKKTETKRQRQRETEGVTEGERKKNDKSDKFLPHQHHMMEGHSLSL